MTWEGQAQYYAGLRAAVVAHYGPACWCCGGTERLTIDHVNGDGHEHREQVMGRSSEAGHQFYRWLIKNGFPPGFETLCLACNASKGNGGRCTLVHGAAREKLCVKCGTARPLAEFYERPGKGDGYRVPCRSCIRSYNSEARQRKLLVEA